jgi:hypothetical protein
VKKFIASAVGLVLAGGIAATSASAVENQFGGYWRSRFTFMDNFDGKDSPSVSFVDQRTRLFYTARFNDDFKFVNKFEFNTGWGDNNGGDLGADGKGNWRIKNSYADFNLGSTLNAKVGIQGMVISRGFLFDDDASGVTLTGKFGNVTVPVFWMNASNEEVQSFDGSGIADFDQNIWAAMGVVQINDDISVTPFFVYHAIDSSETLEDSDNWYLGFDADMKFAAVTVWTTGIYNGGDFDGSDNQGFLGAVGVDAGLVHGQFFYASGDDGGDPTENKAFLPPPGRSYYWSEIMGLGVFDDFVSNGSPGDVISNVWAGNIGITVTPIDKLQMNADIWYASLAEDNTAGDTELGWEFDGKISYSIYDNLTAEAIFAYLLSGDATGEEDVMEGGVQLSLKF